jgi:transcriptional regulator with XRE-family HTH domain
MSRWKALPAELDPRVRQLVVRLRQLKDHGDLSMHRLAAKTGYSRKSWERYLHGRSLPPREAVEALARIGGEDPTRLLVLHELAAEGWERGRRSPTPPEAAAARPESGTADSADSADSANLADSAAVDKPARTHGRALRVAVAAGAVALLLAVSSAVLLVVRLTHDDTGGRTTAPPLSTAAASGPEPGSPPVYTCHVQRVHGQWYAGNSRTRDAILGQGQAGADVAEVQCLLRRAGFSPGVVDGIYGPRTEAAVKDLQHRAGLPPDGIVGPHTWKVLRG